MCLDIVVLQNPYFKAVPSTRFPEVKSLVKSLSQTCSKTDFEGWSANYNITDNMQFTLQDNTKEYCLG